MKRLPLFIAAVLLLASRFAHASYYDKEDNRIYNMARDLDPTNGRYMEPDPIGMAGTSPSARSTYAYAAQNPLSNVDPTGLLRLTATFGGGAVWGPFGFTSETGVGIDDHGNLCYLSNFCTPNLQGTAVIGGMVGAGVSGSIGKGNFCEPTGLNTAEINYQNTIDLGLGGLGAVTQFYDPQSSGGGVSSIVGGGKVFLGGGAGIGSAALRCESRWICVNPFQGLFSQ